MTAASKRKRTSEDQVHLACLHCGKVEEFAALLDPALRMQLARELGFEVQLCRVEAGGVCRLCRATIGHQERIR